jgi:hypothetical protein
MDVVVCHPHKKSERVDWRKSWVVSKPCVSAPELPVTGSIPQPLQSITGQAVIITEGKGMY